jgi:cation:H+ antiporter
VSVTPTLLLAGGGFFLPIFITGQQIDRWEGTLFFGYYIAYALCFILNATGHDALPAFSTVMLEFALPLTIITLVVLITQASRRPSAQTGSDVVR